MIISNIVTNNAAATLVFPIAMTAAEEWGADVVLMSYTLMLGASASFMTPFGYTTNLMIYGPGGYKVRPCLRSLPFLSCRLTSCFLAIVKRFSYGWNTPAICPVDYHYHDVGNL